MKYKKIQKKVKKKSENKFKYLKKQKKYIYYFNNRKMLRKQVNQIGPEVR